ncbi:hypothetical protein MVI01_60510 [Myxococcus virescens]|uniref:Uncharacterized protein n=1 Tax=Myxococcus virescens TaxID=83456 RepID=A0A511HL16_9BACT|nr:hypothetical protein MVI01_60510 [Myxococcus virescens]
MAEKEYATRSPTRARSQGELPRRVGVSVPVSDVVSVTGSWVETSGGAVVSPEGVVWGSTLLQLVPRARAAHSIAERDKEEATGFRIRATSAVRGIASPLSDLDTPGCWPALNFLEFRVP